MKKLLALFLSISFSFTLSAQKNEPDFIEVTVIDSVQVEPETFTFTLFFSPIETVIEDEYKYEENPAIKYVYSLLKEMKLDTVVNDIAFNNMNRGHRQISVLFKSLTDLKEFSKKIRAIQNIQSFLVNTYSSKMKEAANKLYDKLLLKAKEDALLVSSKSQRELDRVIQITIKEAEGTGGWTAYPPLSMLRDADAEPTNPKVIVSKQITVRYSLK
ncbi:hypothetical protein ESA94_17070 [Lacibacter luteus]|uniref:DUF541 domain-containing protein n=1 Tax=Lacibacter luteus TaxID=2508719 RepID=A0A4Q1CF97_9BACT|nr:hypothetical protein [Lacibacter luteus]RXK58353.1 hypothetical protein ESA94_17070 [Lacibacter luteus]